MHEIIHIQLGECGNRIGSKFWNCIFDEHCIDSTGIYFDQSDLCRDRIHTYFDQTSDGKYRPRAILADFDPDMMNSIRNSSVGKQFPSDQMIIAGEYSCASNWGVGYCLQNVELADLVSNKIRQQVELCDNLQGFQMTHSLIGGTGSGFGSFILNQLRDEYPDRLIMTFSCLSSSEIPERVIEPYNIVLGLHHLIENCDSSCLFDNETLLKRRLSSTFEDLNQIIANVISGITTCFRFPDQINGDMRKFTTYSSPYIRLHFLTSSLTPMLSLSLSELRKQMFDNTNLMMPCNFQQGQCHAMTSIFRGQISLQKIDEYFPDSKTTFCRVPLKEFERSLTMIGNHMGMKEIFQRFLEKFTAMFRRKLYIFGLCRSGLDEMEFTEAENNLNDLIDEYQSIE
ncbi:unnamed protein product [Adineta ricciae]|uniref:Tubulin/FtsZ GTPase domain-containing protein n=1 Tax=Adineta ricciae TaxID=249248 RepID=A0A815GGN7_ADIRI|nr:unnamed protein product [Adineta ricciae]CAF1454077.1 unnamed protein product [Adineta ricciae]